MTRTLLSFAGFHDPGLPENPTVGTEAGPILTLVREVGFERIIFGSYCECSRIAL